ncbi:hypothetical protein T261_7925 [Streptomyces lydicus]|nr:hypothetical protein T261_7925 [Streptomyces lydicus]
MPYFSGRRTHCDLVWNCPVREELLDPRPLRIRQRHTRTNERGGQ